VAATKFQAKIVVEVDQPVALIERQISDNGAYIVSQQGRIFFWKYNSQVLAKVLDITSLTSAKGERGLLGLTFRKGFAYLNHTNKAGDTVIAEYALTKTGEFDAKSRRELLVIKQPYSNHNGGAIITGRDNMLYIGTGDGGSSGDPDRTAQNLKSMLGKILRIDPTATSQKRYQIPKDNPYVGVSGALPEIWSIGLRNPWRISFDELNNLWIADVGQNKWEEINVATANSSTGSASGAISTGGRKTNFGWSAFEGSYKFNADQSAPMALKPIYEYKHGDDGCSVSGGVRVSANSPLIALRGWYLFSDYCSGAVTGLKLNGTTLLGREKLVEKLGDVVAVQQTSNGIYVLSMNRNIYSITTS
jgi:hypothetical protein